MVDLSSSIANHINEGSLIEITVPAPRLKPGVWGGARETKHRKAGWGVLLALSKIDFGLRSFPLVLRTK